MAPPVRWVQCGPNPDPEIGMLPQRCLSVHPVPSSPLPPGRFFDPTWRLRVGTPTP